MSGTSAPRVTRSVSKEMESEAISALREEMQAFFKSDELKDLIKCAVIEAIKEDGSGLKEAIHVAVMKVTSTMDQRILVLETQLEDYRAMINDNEQYSRKYNLRFSGLKETNGESCEEKVIDLCKSKLNINPEGSIDRAHRLGPRREGKDRQIIVKFTKFPSKNLIYRSRRLLKGTQVYINEDLTHYNLQLLKHARTQANGVKSAWSSDGKILVKNGDDDIFRIRKMSDFVKNDLY